MKFNTDEYKEFIKDDYELNFILTSSEEPDFVDKMSTVLKLYLEMLVKMNTINKFSIVENRIEIDAPRYVIHMLILHNADVCQYTINKKTNYKGNFSRRMFPEAVINTLDNFI